MKKEMLMHSVCERDRERGDRAGGRERLRYRGREIER